MTAVCLNSSRGAKHIAPDENCDCGIHVASTTGALYPHAPIYGKVAIWGKRIPTSRGWRTAFCYPLELYTRFYESTCVLFAPTKNLLLDKNGMPDFEAVGRDE